MTKFDTNKPIFKQIEERLIDSIIREDYHSGQKLPSVRQLAIELEVNPNTIQRAIFELEKTHLIETKRGRGSFVCANKEIIQDLKKQTAYKTLENAINYLLDLQISSENIKLITQELLENKNENK